MELALLPSIIILLPCKRLQDIHMFPRTEPLACVATSKRFPYDGRHVCDAGWTCLHDSTGVAHMSLKGLKRSFRRGTAASVSAERTIGVTANRRRMKVLCSPGIPSEVKVVQP